MTRCAHCKRDRTIKARGLCPRCHENLDIRRQYERQYSIGLPRAKRCRECQRVKYSLKRGLCHSCYNRPGMLIKYPSGRANYSEDTHGTLPLPDTPTDTPTATWNEEQQQVHAARIEVYAARIAAGQHWSHPDDAKPDLR